MTQETFEPENKNVPNLELKDVVLFGTLSGVSKYYKINVSQLRIAYAVASLFFLNFTLVLYFVMYALIRAKIPFPRFDLSSHAPTNLMIGIVIVLMGFGMIFNFLFPWLNIGFMIAMILLLFGVHMLRHKQLR